MLIYNKEEKWGLKHNNNNKKCKTIEYGKRIPPF
jgi:hypothetical protein